MGDYQKKKNPTEEQDTRIRSKQCERPVSAKLRRGGEGGSCMGYSPERDTGRAWEWRHRTGVGEKKLVNRREGGRGTTRKLRGVAREGEKTWWRLHTEGKVHGGDERRREGCNRAGRRVYAFGALKR